ncbi:chemotaxis protein CheW, partial [Leptospira sp. SA-E8]|uniref:chemotaxis protein CheW n=1 Tax=Leptospira sp. SA-E8 TaxID=3422259 RepID=UPI003EBFBB85
MRLEDGQRGHAMQMATFMLGSYWLGIDAAQVVAATPDATARGAGPSRLPFLGLAPVGDRVCPLLDLRSLVGHGAAGQAQRAANPDRQLIVVSVPQDDGREHEIALRVDALGPMLDLDRRKFQAVGFGAQTALIDAVIGV